VLHVFQKKAKHGIATPKQEIDLAKSRYRLAQQHYLGLPRHEDRDA
jgi:phage-related protein